MEGIIHNCYYSFFPPLFLPFPSQLGCVHLVYTAWPYGDLGNRILLWSVNVVHRLDGKDRQWDTEGQVLKHSPGPRGIP